ncbi:MAG: hypothetical protein KKA64_04795 [Nanoarchaeota archaeon]|nr:hypothetical protein [Nanoarchaeota archaeon]
MNEIIPYLLALALTFILELIIYFIFIRDKWGKIVLYCLLINLFTWPLVNLTHGYFLILWIIEALVILVELILVKLLFRIKLWKAILISFIANLISWLLGSIIYYYLISL